MVTFYACVCVALNYQIIGVFPIVCGDFVGEEYSFDYCFSLTHDYAGMNSVPVETNKIFTFNAKEGKFSFSFTV